MRLRLKITISTLAIALLPFITAMIITLAHNSKYVKSLTLNTVESDLDTVAEALSGYFATRMGEIATYSELPLLKTMDWQKIGPYLRSEVKRHGRTYKKLILGRLDSYYYTTAGGNAAHGGLTTFDDTDPDAKLKSIIKRPYWQITTVKNTENRKNVYVSDPMIAYATGVKQVMIAASIISDKGKTVGMTGGAIEWSEIESLINGIRDRILKKASLDQKMFLVSADGVYIYHWDPEKIVHMLLDPTGKPLLNDIGEKIVSMTRVTEEPVPELAQAGNLMINGKSGTVFYVDPKTHKQMATVFAPVTSARYSIAMVLPKSLIVKPVINLQMRLITVMVTTIIVVLAISLFMAHKVSTPIVSLSNAAKQIARGQKHATVKTTSKDEVGKLTEAFNSMAISLQEREQSLKDSEQRYRTLAENIPGIVYRSEIDFPWHMMHISEAVASITKYSAADFIDRKVAYGNIVAPHDLEHVEKAIKDASDSHEPFTIEYGVVDADGNTRYVFEKGQFIYNENNKPLWLDGVIMDITEHKQAVEQDVEKGRFIKKAIDALDHPFYVINIDDYSIAMANSTALEDRVLEKGLTCYNLTHRDKKPCKSPKHPCPIEEIRKTHKPVTVEHVHYDASGNKRFYEVHAHPIFDRSGKLTQVIEYNVDITEKKQAQMEQQRLVKILEAKNKELQSIVYIASHDLKSPLVNISGFGEELSMNCDHLSKLLTKTELTESDKKNVDEIIKESVPESLEFINAGTKKINMLINGLLQVSRAGSTKLNIEPLDMNNIMKDIVETIGFQARQAGVSISVDDLPPCMGDLPKTNQVFSNLLSNALKYLDPSREGKIHIAGWKENHINVYCIEDNGIGIAPDYLEKIFEVFHRLHPDDSAGGEGIGLTIVMRILDRQNGRIWVESKPGKGSKFYVSLPAP